MAEAGLFIGWGEVVRGREKRALKLFNEAMQYWGGLQQKEQIERFDVAVLTPHGGDLRGFILLRGTEQQIDSLRRDEEFQRWIALVQLMTDQSGVADASVDEGLARAMSLYQDVLEKEPD
jgi:hypothetical protein